MDIWRNFSQIITLNKAFHKDGRNLRPNDLSIIEDGAIIFDKDQIVWVGPDNEVPSKYLESPEFKITDFSGHILTPEIVDSHTHLVFAGDRSSEYAMRLNGATYQEIANKGGGILSTSKSTRQTDSETLFQESVQKIKQMHSYGVGTIEIKSGYGLSYKDEYRISHVIDRLKKHFSPSVQIINTFMAAHAIPKEFQNSKPYLTEVVFPLMDKLQQEKIIDTVDIFHEEGYFDYEDTKKLFQYAKKLNLPFKSHADEFQDNKGALLAAELGAISTDHLLSTGSDGIESLSNSKTVATLLPGTGFFLGKAQANARHLLDSGCKVALATDYNPGSCHFNNLLFLASLAAPSLQMNQAELWTAITLNGAHALGLMDQGTIVEGKKPRFSIFNVNHIDQITYSWNTNYAVNISSP